ncbi:MAG: hypothetical protein IJ325_01680 [Clostridia bacterium]|nr:hypothetical protein [Clostridia bacterium]
MRVLIRKRADLPEMTWPLAVISVLLTVAAAWMGAEIGVSPMGGPVTALPFLALSAAVYSAVIVLWRKVAALLITPITALCLWISDCGMFCTVTVSLSLLFVSYLTGICLLAGEKRFMRMTSLSCGIAVALGLCAAAGVSLAYPSLSAFYEETVDAVDILLKQLPETAGISPDTYSAADLAHTMFLSLPALLGVTAELLAASVLFLCKTFLRIFDCAAYFHPDADAGITTPRSFGAVALITLILTLLTSPMDNPLLYSILSNILSVITIPCAYVGVREFFGRMQKKVFIYHLSPSGVRRRHFPLSSVLLLVFLTLFLGLSGALSLSAAMGAFYILRAGRTADPAPEQSSGS